MTSTVALMVCAMFAILNTVFEPVDATCPAGPKTAEQLLRSQLFCGYDTSVRPVTTGNTTRVSAFIRVMSLIFHEHLNKLEVHSWMGWSWKDENLKWNTSKFEMKSIVVSSSELWVPDVSLYFSGEISSVAFRMRDTLCALTYNGNVVCAPATVYTSYCDADITKWPFDQHTCTMQIGSFQNLQDNINLTLNGKGISTADYTPSRDWELLNSSAELKVKNEYPQVFFSFVLKRHSGGHAATVFIPSLVLGTLTLAVFFIEPNAVERLCLICINIICHSLYLQYLAAKLPANGDKYPTILLFFRDSLLLASVSLFVTLVVRRLDAASSRPPVWITTVTTAVLATLPGQVLMAGETYNKHHGAGYDDVTELVETSDKDQRWHLFAVLLDRTFFLIAFLTLFILLCALVP